MTACRTLTGHPEELARCLRQQPIRWGSSGAGCGPAAAAGHRRRWGADWRSSSPWRAQWAARGGRCERERRFGPAGLDGGRYWGGPLQVGMEMFTADPGATVVPAAGCWNCTISGSMQVLGCAIVPTVSPAAWIWATAGDWVRPRTSGTVAAPSDTVRLTGECIGSTVPPGEFWLMTVPAGARLTTGETVPTDRPAAVMAWVAAVWLDPRTFGTIVVVSKALLKAQASVCASYGTPVGVPSIVRVPSILTGTPE